MDYNKLELVVKINKQYNFLDYLKNYEKVRKCIVIITDSQIAFLPAINEFKNEDHYSLENNLLKTMNLDIEVDKGLLCIAAINNELCICLPEDQIVTLNQAALFYKILDQIDQYDRQVKVNQSKLFLIDMPCDENIDSIKKCILNYISDRKTLDKENIIGIVPNKSDRKKVLMEYLKNQNIVSAGKLK